MSGVWGFFAQLLAPTYPYQWECELEECDGQPHEGRAYAHARTSQRAPKGTWDKLLMLCGRGFGKTRSGSEIFLERVLANPVDVQGRPTWWLIGSRTHSETVALMVEGVSSLKYAFERRGIAFRWNSNKGEIVLPTGQIIRTQHAEGNAEFGRGGEWAGVWIDEVGTFKRIKDAYENALPFSMRAMLPSGEDPFLLMTTTPKAEYAEPFAIMKQLVAEATADGDVRLVRGSTWDNLANLPPRKVEQWKRTYPEGSRSRRQELDAELLDSVDGALWTQELLDRHRVIYEPGETLQDVIRRLCLVRTVVSIDPAGTKSPKSDETAIVGFGQDLNADGFVLADRSGHYTPGAWARAALQLAIDIEAGAVVVEVSGAGSDSLTYVLQQEASKMVAEGLLWIAPEIVEVKATGSTGGKNTRAMPVAGYFHQQRIRLVGGLPGLEDQLCSWTPLAGWSPDRLDAMVWAAWSLMEPQKDDSVATY